jgi:hypothetical protein
MAGDFGIRITGFKEVKRRLEKADDASLNVRRAAFEVINEVFKDSQRLVPRDTGALASSGEISQDLKKNGYSLSIAYGGPSADYAIVVHEDVKAFHAPPTRSKYLEAPFHEKRDEMAKRLAKAAKQGTKGI